MLLSNTPAQAESLLYSLEQAARGIDLYVITNKSEYMSFKQKGAISWDKPLILVDQFTYIDSNILSTEGDINVHIKKA